MAEFKLSRPCSKCPFRTDVPGYLRRGRAAEIAGALDRSTFSCHETVHALGAPKSKPEQHCAGALIMMEREGVRGQMVRIAGRLGLYDPSKLDTGAPVHASREEFIEHHND